MSDDSEDGGYDFDERGSDISHASDDEEEGGQEGFLDEEASDVESDAPSDDDSNSGASLASGKGNHGFFDIEALDSDSHSDESSTLSGSDAEYEARTFHPFPRLPAELREMVWLQFCPDLIAKSRVFELMLISYQQGSANEVWESAVLDQQTQPARAVLSTYRESRSLALRSLPDTLPIRRGTGCVRFNREKDVVFLMSDLGNRRCIIPEFTDKIKHLALESQFLSFDPSLSKFGAMLANVREFIQSFPRLETVFSVFPDSDCSTADLSWLRLNELHAYHVHTDPGKRTLDGEEEIDYTYCWPVPHGLDVIRTLFSVHPKGNDKDEDDEQGKDEDEAGSGSESPDDGESDEDESDEDEVDDRKAMFQAVVSRHAAHGYWHLPMIQFQFEEGLRMFDTVQRWRDSDSSCNPIAPFHHDLPPDVGPDEYESEGIDDGDIPEGESLSEEESEPEMRTNYVEDSDGLASDDYDLAISPPHGEGLRVEDLFDSEHDTESDDASEDDDDQTDPSTDSDSAQQLAGADLLAANFSSPEPNPRDNTNSEGSSSEDEPSARVASRPKRHAVPSDSDESHAEEKVVLSHRRAKRRIVSSDSESVSDSDVVVSRPAKRARVIVSDDDDDEE